MKRNLFMICLLMLTAVSPFLSACGGETEVPDKYIDYAVKDAINDNYLLSAGGFESYNYSARHSPDNSSHTDEVDVTIQVKYPCGDVIIQGSQRYQYSNGSDTWSELKSWGWKIKEKTVNAKALIGTWSGVYCDYELNIEAVDLNTGTITCDYSFSCTEGTPWTGGSTQVTYAGHDTFELESSYDGGYEFVINETGRTFWVAISVERGAYLLG